MREIRNYRLFGMEPKSFCGKDTQKENSIVVFLISCVFMYTESEKMFKELKDSYVLSSSICRRVAVGVRMGLICEVGFKLTEIMFEFRRNFLSFIFRKETLKSNHKNI